MEAGNLGERNQQQETPSTDRPDEWIRRFVVLLLSVLLLIALVSIFVADPNSIGEPPILVFVFLAAVLGSATNLSLTKGGSRGKEAPSLGSARDQLYFLAWKSLVAIVFAVFLYISFMSGIISGTLFPEFQNLDGEDGMYVGMRELMERCRPSTNADAAKMFVWAFIAGYLERFVPSLIQKTSAKVERQ